MTVTDVRKDPQTLTMIVFAEFDVPIERAWQLWEDPRLLERWWGPPAYPATFVEHDLRAGGRMTYYMTGPEGDRSHGWWRVEVAEPPRRIELEDGFATADGDPNPEMPTMRMRVDLSERAGGGKTNDDSGYCLSPSLLARRRAAPRMSPRLAPESEEP